MGLRFPLRISSSPLQILFPTPPSHTLLMLKAELQLDQSHE